MAEFVPVDHNPFGTDAGTTLARVADEVSGIPDRGPPTFTASDSMSRFYDVWKRGSDKYAGMVDNPLDISRLGDTWQNEPGLSAASGFGPGNVGVAGIFAGPVAATADRHALKIAMSMAERGMSRDEIWNATGWFTGADGKWRFEIPDNMLWVNPSANPKGISRASAISHPDLAQAYPKLSELVSDVRIDEKYRNEGSLYSSIPPKMQIKARTATADARPIAAHELQHAVQDIEGFAYGTDPSDKTIKSMVARTLDKMGWKEGEKGYKTLARDAAYEIYRRYYGEIEARNVANRLYLTPEQRQSMPPWQTQEQFSSQETMLRNPKLVPVDHDPFAGEK